MKHSTVGTMKPSLADFDDTGCVGRALRLLKLAPTGREENFMNPG